MEILSPTTLFTRFLIMEFASSSSLRSTGNSRLSVILSMSNSHPFDLKLKLTLPRIPDTSISIYASSPALLTSPESISSAASMVLAFSFFDIFFSVRVASTKSIPSLILSFFDNILFFFIKVVLPGIKN